MGSLPYPDPGAQAEQTSSLEASPVPGQTATPPLTGELQVLVAVLTDCLQSDRGGQLDHSSQASQLPSTEEEITDFRKYANYDKTLQVHNFL